jgi:hypothetical protein
MGRSKAWLSLFIQSFSWMGLFFLFLRVTPFRSLSPQNAIMFHILTRRSYQDIRKKMQHFSAVFFHFLEESSTAVLITPTPPSPPSPEAHTITSSSPLALHRISPSFFPLSLSLHLHFFPFSLIFGFSSFHSLTQSTFIKLT